MTQLTPSAKLPTLVEGDDYQFSIAFTDRAGDPIDITDWTVSMTIVDRQTQGGGPIVERDITSHDDATGGKTSWDIPGSETAGTTGTKRYDIQVVKSDGTTRTVALGTVGFLDGATDRAISGSGGSGVGASTGAAIDVTLDGDDSISLSIQGLTNYTDADVIDAINGAAISPGEVSVEKVGVYATLSSGQTISPNTNTKLDFGNIVQDDRNEYDPQDNKAVLKTGGEYALSAKAFINGYSGGSIKCAIVVNGEEVSAYRTENEEVVRARKDISLSKGDRVYTTLKHTAAASEDVMALDQWTFFSVKRFA